MHTFKSWWNNTDTLLLWRNNKISAEELIITISRRDLIKTTSLVTISFIILYLSTQGN